MDAAYLKIDGTPVDDALLAEVTVTQELNNHWWCHIGLRQTEDKRFAAEEMLGKDIQISTVNAEGAEQIVFAGLIVESELQFEIYGSYTGRIVAVSKSYLLDLTVRRNYFSAQTAKGAVEKIASNAGLALQGNMPAGASRDFHQLEETDFDFVRRLVDDSEAWLRPSKDGVEVQTAFQKGVTLNWRAEGGLIHFRVRGRLSQPSCNGAQYDPLAMQSEVFEDIEDRAAFSGSVAGMVAAVLNQSKALIPSSYIGQRARVATVAAYHDLLKKESRRSLGRSITCSGESREPLLRAGDQVSIKGVLDAQGVYGITQVVHHWDSAGYTNRFECTPWTKYTSPNAPQLRRCHGIVPARVTDNNDPDNQGRIRVQFYWQEDSQTNWLPMMAPHAGSDRGFMFLPEVGDEVWVAFEEGDPERGRVLGCAWNGVQKPPREEFWGDDVAPNDVKRIVTKSGHRITIVDKEGKSSIVLATPKHVKISLIENTNETGDSMLAMHSDGDIFLSAPNGRIHFHSKYFSREVG